MISGSGKVSASRCVRIAAGIQFSYWIRKWNTFPKILILSSDSAIRATLLNYQQSKCVSDPLGRGGSSAIDVAEAILDDRVSVTVGRKKRRDLEEAEARAIGVERKQPKADGSSKLQARRPCTTKWDLPRGAWAAPVDASCYPGGQHTVSPLSGMRPFRPLLSNSQG